MQLSDYEISQRLQKITVRGRQRIWELMGIDGSAIRNVAQDVNQQLIVLADDVQNQLKNSDSAQLVARQQAQSLKYLKQLSELEAQGIIPTGSIDDFVAPSLCQCGIAMFAEAVGHNNPLPETTGNAQGSVTWEPPEDSCFGHPIVDAQGNGNLSAAELDSICTFTFTPSSTSLYCIRPVVQLNGHYLAWTWGGCEQEEPGRASVQVRLAVTVEQPGANLVRTQEQTVVNESASFPIGDSTLQSGFAYDSALQGGTGINAVLISGEEVTVRITCTSVARVLNLGRAWVDMQTSPEFYFRVPYVRWGIRTCS
ncbi:MAG: hypothetical protein F6K41_40300 [Symploca sp. SIO3E6]|nr:hypothetical protein [Caldora sp. SIO3E6]